jgi:hypothetical protein
VGLALAERRSQAFLLKRRKWAEVPVDSLDIIPFLNGQINWHAQLESGISASANQGGNSSGFGLGSIWLIIFENR